MSQNIRGERPSRWQKSKTWRSPSSPQIHQKYIYMWNSSYRTNTYWTLAEDLRPPKRQELPTYLGRQKKKETETKEYGWDLHLWEVKEEKFPHTRKALHWQGQGVGRGGSFGATEESTVTGVQGAKQRDSHTEDRCRPGLTSPRGLSAHPPGRVGAGSWGSGFGGQIPGRRLGLAAWTQPEGGWCTTASREGVQGKVWTCLRGKGPLFWSAQGEGIQSTRSEERRVGKECRSRWSPYH